MIDAETLRALGWSDELIRAAEHVAQTVETGTGSVSINQVEVLAADPFSVTGSQGADVSGPPIAKPELLIVAK
jgi:hypothetical protein